MAASVLAHAARRQGRQGLLAWRAAAAEAQAAPQLLQGAGQQGQGQVLPWQGPADAEVPQQQWAGSRRSLHTAAGPSSGIAAAAAATAGSAASPAALAAGLFAASQASSAASLWLAQQRRGMALNFSRYQPRRKPQEDRNLPEKNEQIRAKEVRGARHLYCCTLLHVCWRLEPAGEERGYTGGRGSLCANWVSGRVPHLDCVPTWRPACGSMRAGTGLALRLQPYTLLTCLQVGVLFRGCCSPTRAGPAAHHLLPVMQLAPIVLPGC